MSSNSILEKAPPEKAGFESSSDTKQDTEANEISTTKLLRKLDLHLLPPLSLLYLLSFLDRSNGKGPIQSLLLLV
jgi:hypothetical protein